mmetsp:Transcript_18883/g.46789  ORF Transcript_18883/g.46789 Transcript_18883/m.46789 type:complete len:325 (-) Transcript_18883:289-1263(-)
MRKVGQPLWPLPHFQASSGRKVDSCHLGAAHLFQKRSLHFVRHLFALDFFWDILLVSDLVGRFPIVQFEDFVDHQVGDDILKLFILGQYIPDIVHTGHDINSRKDPPRVFWCLFHSNHWFSRNQTRVGIQKGWRHFTRIVINILKRQIRNVHIGHGVIVNQAQDFVLGNSFRLGNRCSGTFGLGNGCHLNGLYGFQGLFLGLFQGFSSNFQGPINFFQGLFHGSKGILNDFYQHLVVFGKRSRLGCIILIVLLDKVFHFFYSRQTSIFQDGSNRTGHWNGFRCRCERTFDKFPCQPLDSGSHATSGKAIGRFFLSFIFFLVVDV